MKKILVVDDLSHIRLIINKILIANGYEFIEANDGKSAISLAEKENPDLILLDVDMPDMSGFEVCKELRKLDALRFTKIIFVSAQVNVNSVIEGLEVGGNDYIKKPFNPGELLSRIKVHLNWKEDELQNEIKNKIIRTFSMFFSHEIRTPLNGIIGFSDLAKMEANQETIELLDTVTEAAQNLNTFISKALTLTQVCEADKYNDQCLQVNSEGSCLKMEPYFPDLKSKSKEKQIELKIDLDPRAIEGNPHLINLASGLLIDNAINFSPKNSTVAVDYKDEGSHIDITIRDEGPGIDPNKKDLIFDFLTKDIAHHQGGGLSLTLVKNIMELHNGKVLVESSKDSGTAFTLRFPKNSAS